MSKRNIDSDMYKLFFFLACLLRTYQTTVVTAVAVVVVD